MGYTSRRVFIVVTGNIYDPATWGIEAVFSDRNKAEEFKEKFKQDNPEMFYEGSGWIIRVEEHDVR